MIYNIPKRSDYTYYPKSVSAAWIIKIIYPCRYSGLSVNKKHHWLESMQGTKWVFYASWDNVAEVNCEDL